MSIYTHFTKYLVVLTQFWLKYGLTHFLLNKKEDVLKNYTVFGPHDFHSKKTKNTMEVNGEVS